ncbi:MAG: tetratricopeptide repeat protein [Chloroflexi bacterium]|nr:tetratricopeptide repeat protein [Chloroflexota bacterium]
MAFINQRLGLSRYEADEYYRMALEAYQKKRLDDAILNMNEAITLLPTRAEYWAARGFFYLEDGVLDKAQADFEQALRRHRFEMLAHYGRGVIAYKDRNWQEALAHFSDAYRSDPKRPETLYYLALCFHRTGDNTAALRMMEQAAAAFTDLDERRKADALRWVKEFQRILGSAASLPPG